MCSIAKILTEKNIIEKTFRLFLIRFKDFFLILYLCGDYSLKCKKTDKFAS